MGGRSSCDCTGVLARLTPKFTAALKKTPRPPRCRTSVEDVCDNCKAKWKLTMERVPRGSGAYSHD